MGFRFHKSLKILSGLRMNMSKSGPSVSVGGKGLSYNFGLKRNRASVGLPGTGVSYQTTSSNGGRSKTSIFGIIVMVLAIGYAVFNAATDGKYSIDHWKKVIAHQIAGDEDKKQANDARDDEPAHKRKHRSVIKTSD